MRRPTNLIVAFLSPACVLYGLVFVFPTLRSFYVSLHEWSGFTANMKYVGLANFRELFHDGIFWQAIRNNLFLVFVGGILVLALALFFSTTIKHVRPFLEKTLTSVIFFPHLLTAVSVAILWKFIYNPRWGLLNAFLTAVGLGRLAQPWLGKSHLVMSAILVPIAWMTVGFYMLILKAGMDRIPISYFEAAEIDGASRWQMFRYLTLPLLNDVLMICVVLWAIAALKHFGLVFAMTGGGPSQTSQLIAVYLFITAFEAPGGQGSSMRMGYATAMAIVLFALVIVFYVVQLLLKRKERYEY